VVGMIANDVTPNTKKPLQSKAKLYSSNVGHVGKWDGTQGGGRATVIVLGRHDPSTTVRASRYTCPRYIRTPRLVTRVMGGVVLKSESDSSPH
jgi:hypothetical protein